MEWTKLDIAEGIAVAGLMKFSRASTAPKPEFCMPTSMAIVLLTAVFFKIILLKKYPKIKPNKCNSRIAAMRFKPELKIISFP